MNGFEPIIGHVGVDLCGGDVRMSEEHLNRTEIRTMVQQMGRERMA